MKFCHHQNGEEMVVERQLCFELRIARKEFSVLEEGQLRILIVCNWTATFYVYLMLSYVYYATFCVYYLTFIMQILCLLFYVYCATFCVYYFMFIMQLFTFIILCLSCNFSHLLFYIYYATFYVYIIFYMCKNLIHIHA